MPHSCSIGGPLQLQHRTSCQHCVECMCRCDAMQVAGGCLHMIAHLRLTLADAGDSHSLTPSSVTAEVGVLQAHG